MKLSLAWANMAAQNVNLKFTTLLLGLLSGALTVCILKLSLKNPIIIDRGCSSVVVETSTNEHSSNEIESFVRDAIRQRFNSDASPIFSFLSEEETYARQQEQKEFITRSMTQTVLVRTVKMNGNTIAIDADRLIGIAQVRSAFLFPLTATIRSIPRNSQNPYGLELVKISPQKTESEVLKNEDHH